MRKWRKNTNREKSVVMRVFCNGASGCTAMGVPGTTMKGAPLYIEQRSDKENAKEIKKKTKRYCYAQPIIDADAYTPTNTLLLVCMRVLCVVLTYMCVGAHLPKSYNNKPCEMSVCMCVCICSNNNSAKNNDCMQ